MLPSWTALGRLTRPGRTLHIRPRPCPQTCGETGLFVDNPGGPVAAGANPSRAVASAAGPWGPAVNYHRLRRPDELGHQPPVLHAGRRLDAGADVDAVGGQGPYRRRDVARRETAGDDQPRMPAPRRRRSPVEAVARAVLARVEQVGVGGVAGEAVGRGRR